MYESETDGPKQVDVRNAMACKMATSNFRVQFNPSNDFEKGMSVAVLVDGVLCTSKESAISLATKRINELYGQWAEYVAKM